MNKLSLSTDLQDQAHQDDCQVILLLPFMHMACANDSQIDGHCEYRNMHISLNKRELYIRLFYIEHRTFLYNLGFLTYSSNNVRLA